MISFTRRCFLFIFVIAFSLTATTAAAQAQPGTPAPVSSSAPPRAFSGPLPVFEFHSGFWTNLHHFLYQQARLKKSLETSGEARLGPSSLTQPAGAASIEQPARVDGLSASERVAWNSSLAYYTRNIADKDLLFNGDLVNYKNQLAEFETCADLSGRSKPQCDVGIPSDIAKALETAAPVYRAHWWIEHDRLNRLWINSVSPLVREMGAGMAQELAVVYQARWPSDKIRVDVTAYAGWAGAYTTLDPVDVTVSSDQRDQGLPGFEILFHEASHALAEFVRDAIARECRERAKPIPRDLWHALLFYTTGEIVRRAVNAHELPVGNTSSAHREGPDAVSGQDSQRKSKPGPTAYTPYAFREGLYTRGWGDYLRVLERFWQPYLDGKVEFSVAIARIVSAL
jgi:hypothetical protein